MPTRHKIILNMSAMKSCSTRISNLPKDAVVCLSICHAENMLLTISSDITLSMPKPEMVDIFHAFKAYGWALILIPAWPMKISCSWRIYHIINLIWRHGIKIVYSSDKIARISINAELFIGAPFSARCLIVGGTMAMTRGIAWCRVAGFMTRDNRNNEWHLSVPRAKRLAACLMI